MHCHALGRQITLALALSLSGFLVGCSSIFGNAGNPLAVGWGPPFEKDSTLGRSLEHRFGVMLKSCRVAKLDKDPRSSIPAVIQQAMEGNLTKTVVSIDGQSSWNLFRFVSPREVINLGGSSRFRDYLTEGTIPQFALPRPDPGSSSVYYKQTCSSVVQAAIEANLKVPVVSVEAAVQSGFQNHSELAIVQGRFFSPLSILLSPSTSQPDRLRTLMGVWMWYANRPPDSPRARFYYLAGFNGVALYNIRRSAAKTEGVIRAKAGTSFAIGGLETDFSGELTSEAAANVESFETFLYPNPTRDSATTGKPDDLPYQVEQLPTPEEIARVWREVSPRLTSTIVSDTLNLGFKNTVDATFQVREVPTNMCSGDRWRTANAASTFVMAALGDTACQVRISASMDHYWIASHQSGYSNTLETLTLNSTIPRVDSVSEKSFAVSLQLALPSPRFTVVSDPTINGRAGAPRSHDLPNEEFRMTWPISFVVGKTTARELAWAEVPNERLIESEFVTCEELRDTIALGITHRVEQTSNVQADQASRTISLDLTVVTDRPEPTCQATLVLRLPLATPFRGEQTMIRMPERLTLSPASRRR